MRIKTSMTRQKVILGVCIFLPPFGRSTVISVFVEGDFILAIDKPPQASEGNTANGDKIRDMGKHAISQQRERFATEIGTIAELLERNAGEQQDRSPPDFV